MRGTTSLLLLTLAALSGCKSAPAPLTDADRATARQMDSAFGAATSAGNVEGMMAGYAPNAMVMPPNMPTAHGSDQIRQLWQGTTSQKATLQLTQETADGAGDFMFTSGKYHFQYLPAETSPSEDGKYLLVYRRGADGKWMIVAESWSSNAPPAPAPPAKPAAARRAR